MGQSWMNEGRGMLAIGSREIYKELLAKLCLYQVVRRGL